MLNRLLVKGSFLLLGLNTSSKILSFGGSDHKPILLEVIKDKNIGPIPLWFSPLWVSHKEFLEIVTETWLAPITGSPFYVWKEKLRRVKRVLKSWDKYVASLDQRRAKATLTLKAH